MRVLGPGAVSWNRAGRSRRPIRLFHHVGASCRPKTEAGRHDQDRDTASPSQCALIDGLTAFGLEQRPIKTDRLPNPSGNSTKAAPRTYLTGRPTDDDRREQRGLVGYTSANWSHLGASRERAKHVEWGHTAGIGMVCAPLGRRRGRPLGRNTCEPRLFFRSDRWDKGERGRRPPAACGASRRSEPQCNATRSVGRVLDKERANDSVVSNQGTIESGLRATTRFRLGATAGRQWPVANGGQW